MSLASQSYCLILTPELETDLPVRVVERGLRVFELDRFDKLTNQAGKLGRAKAAKAAVLLESIRRQSHQLLLMSAPAKLHVTVNGLRVTGLASLEPGDVLDIDGLTLHVTLLSRPYIGPPEKSHLGVKCGYCRVEIPDAPDMRVYACPNCGLPTHYQSDEVPVETRLECAKLSAHCGHCQSAIVESEGFTHVPVF